MARTLVLVLLFAFAVASHAAAVPVRVECIEGCLPRAADPTADVLIRRDLATAVTLRWTFGENPLHDQETLRLFAGNPLVQEMVPDRGPLALAAGDGVWTASFRVPADDLGGGTFLAVLVHQRGEDERILDWRAFRPLTAEDEERMNQDVAPQGQWSLDVRPSVLQATSGRGELPRAASGDERVWWSLARSGLDAGDLDLDGDNNGIPGLGIQVSTPWEAGAGRANWRQAILDKLTGVPGHTVEFQDLEWVEQPERSLGAVEGLGEIRERHYYTVVTLFTNASIATFDAKDVGGGSLFANPTYFAHETTARLKHTRDVRFWASYSRRDYGSDRHLLQLLQKQYWREKSVPGLGPIQVDDGDGGAVTYRVGFVARARPWEGSVPGKAAFRAGFVGIDVVAARAGIGGVETHGSFGQSQLQEVWCKVVRCQQGSRTLDLDVPPPGYEVAQPVASLVTLSGSVAMTEGKPRVAAKGSEINLPSLTRFAVAANLRAGALIRKASFGNTRNLVPVNSYAQYVLKLTVAMVRDTNMITGNEIVMPDPGQLNTQTVVPKATGLLAWLRQHLVGFGAGVVLIAAAILVIAVPGFRTLLSSLLGVVGSLLKKVSGK